jgi:hypothetical protein
MTKRNARTKPIAKTTTNLFVRVIICSRKCSFRTERGDVVAAPFRVPERNFTSLTFAEFERILLHGHRYGDRRHSERAFDIRDSCLVQLLGMLYAYHFCNSHSSFLLFQNYLYVLSRDLEVGAHFSLTLLRNTNF